VADSGWLVVAGAVVGGALTGTIALFQARSQHRLDVFKLQEERKWNERVVAKERDHAEMTKRSEKLLQIYTRYQLAADRLENAIRELAEARRYGTFGEHPERVGTASPMDRNAEVEKSKGLFVMKRGTGCC